MCTWAHMRSRDRYEGERQSYKQQLPMHAGGGTGLHGPCQRNRGRSANGCACIAVMHQLALSCGRSRWPWLQAAQVYGGAATSAATRPARASAGDRAPLQQQPARAPASAE